jgi:hypothetical protein
MTATNYLSSAFYSQYNLILLGGSALFSLASASPLPLALGVAGEVMWLGLGSRLAGFRRRIDQQLEAQRHAAVDDELMAGMRGLGTEHSQRLLGVGQAISAISMHASASSHDPLLRDSLRELEQLRPVFLRFCQLHERLTQRLQELALSPPQHEVQLLSQAYAAEKDLGARFTLHQSIKLAQKKVEQQSRMTDMRRGIELKLALVEQALAHLQNQLELGASASDLARDMSGLVAQVGTPANLEAELGASASGRLSVPPPSLPSMAPR